MLPFSLKIVWFAFSLLGLIACLSVWLIFVRAHGVLWGPLLYSIGCILLEVMFCLGIIWRMDPMSMPHSFCLAQTFLSGIANFLLTGVVSALALATSLVVHKPKTWGDSVSNALRWRSLYFVPIIVFPCAACIVQVAVLLKLDAVHPSDGLHCDATTPLWSRFMGTTGAPLILAFPTLYISTKSVLRVIKTNRHLERARHSDNMMLFNDETPLPKGLSIRTPASASPLELQSNPKPENRQKTRQFFQMTPFTSISTTTTIDGIKRSADTTIPSPTAKSAPAYSTRNSRRTKKGTRNDENETSSSSPSEEDDDSAFDGRSASPDSLAMPAFAPSIPTSPIATSLNIPTPTGPGAAPFDVTNEPGTPTTRHSSPNTRHRRLTPEISELVVAYDNTPSRPPSSRTHGSNRVADGPDVWTMVGDDLKDGVRRPGAVVKVNWTGERGADGSPDEEGWDEKNPDRDEYLGEENEDGTQDGKGDGVRMHRYRRSVAGVARRRRPPPPGLASPIWRLIILTIVISLAQLLSIITTIIDLAKHRTYPSPFGTHHVSLLILIWGPVLTLGPVFEFNLLAWTRKTVRLPVFSR